MINIIVLSLIISILIGTTIFLFTTFFCIAKCNKCGISDGCGGTCPCDKGQHCIANECFDNIIENLQDSVCTDESEPIVKDGICKPCCNGLIPYTDGACHKWPHLVDNVDIDYNPPSCVKKPAQGCTKDGDDMFMNDGMCLPCCSGLNSYLIAKDECTDNASYTYYCYSADTASMFSGDSISSRNNYFASPEYCTPFKGINTSLAPAVK
jgi:hypothetical protein